MSRVAAVLILVFFVALSLPAPDVVAPPSPVPEPGTMMLMGAGVAAAIIFAKIRKSRR
jgi:predicted tellurium resistance membrane protein TerC